MLFRSRVFDASGALLYSDNDFVQEDYHVVNYNGLNDWTLALWYSRASPTGSPTFGDFQVNQHPGTGQAATTLQSLLMGNNGAVQPTGATPGRFWYYAGVQLCANTWCGP